MLTVILNAVLNIVLIPLWGIFGAAVATTSAFVFEAITTLLVTNRHLARTRKPDHGTA